MTRYWREVREIADQEAVSIDEARALWGDRYERVGVRRRVKNIVVALTATATSTYCPLCRDDLGAEEIFTCVRCQTRFHTECWGEMGENCTTLGCAARRMVRFPRPVQPTEISAQPQNLRADVTPAGVNLRWDTPNEHFCNGCRTMAASPLVERNGIYRCSTCWNGVERRSRLTPTLLVAVVTIPMAIAALIVLLLWLSR